MVYCRIMVKLRGELGDIWTKIGKCSFSLFFVFLPKFGVRLQYFLRLGQMSVTHFLLKDMIKQRKVSRNSIWDPFEFHSIFQ